MPKTLSGTVAVTVDCNLFRGKTHVNPISRLVEPIANAIEHGKADRVDVRLERLQQVGLVFSVTEAGGAGMTPQEAEDAIRFGHHAAKASGSEKLANYSHNGIGTKACLNFFSRLAIFSVQRPAAKSAAATYVLLLLDVADKNGDGTCQPARRLVWTGGSGSGGQPNWGGDDAAERKLKQEVVGELAYLAAPRTAAAVGAEFAKIGEASGSRLVYFGAEGREGTSEAKNQFILAGDDVRVHPGALASGVAHEGAQANSCPLYVTSLRHRLRHFLATPSTTLTLNGVKVQAAGAGEH